MSAIKNNYESKTLWVVLLTAVTMVVEIYFGLSTKSMALLADGIHMGSHVLAIGLSWVASEAVMRTVANADKIVVLKDAQVVEQGAPQELLKKPEGVYKNMVELQTSNNRR